MRYLVIAAFGVIAMASAAAACPTYNQTGATYTYTGQQLYSPQSFGVTAGGQNNIGDCNIPGVNRTGYVTSAPDFTFYLSGMDQYYLVADVVAQCDSVLLVNTANATWMFDDDSNPNGSLDPRIEIRGAQNLNGRVDVWVGTYSNQYCDATLNMETWLAASNGGGFTPVPTPTPTPQPTPQPAGNCPSWQQTGQVVNITGQQLYSPTSYNVQAGGSTNISNCGVGGRGYAYEVPHYSFNLSGMESYGRLEIEVTSAQCDTTLLVNTPTTQWYFDDDSRGNLQPLLNIPSSASLNGRLDLWVGTYNGATCPATVELETWNSAASNGGGFTPVPTPTPTPQPTPQPAGNCPSWQQTGQVVNITGQQLYSPTSYNVQAGGSTNISNCGVGGRGYAYEVPHYSFNLSGMESYGRLEIEVTSAQCDTTLLVNTPTTQWYFDDDSRGNLQPLLNIPSSASLNGRLDLWVGTYNGATCPATVELETWLN